MLTIAVLLAASQVPPAADMDELRWRRFVRTAVAETPFSARMSALHRAVRLLPADRQERHPRGVGGPSGL